MLSHVLVCLTLAAACPQERRVAIEVSFVAGRNVYVTPGREAGLQVGDRIVLEVVGGASISGRVESISKSQARAVVEDARIQLVAGLRGYAIVNTQAETVEDADRPEPPAWKREAAPADPDAPLLRLGKVTEAAERPTRWSGRFDARADVYKNLTGAREQSTWMRSGLDIGASNPFGHGGALRADAEFALRSLQSRFSSDNASTKTRIDRLEHSWGFNRETPLGFTLGRFLQREMSEFGLLDGVQVLQAIDKEKSVSAAVGFLPQPLATRATGDDVAMSLSYSQVFGDEDQARLRLGLQKTWHRGRADRDLLVSSVSWRPSTQTSLQGSVWVDYYGSDERARSQGLDITDLQLHVSHRLSDAHGLSLYASRLHWPDLRRMEFDEVPIDVLRNEERRNLGLSSWHALSETLWLDLRVDGWQDRRDDGVSADASLRMRDLIAERGDVTVGVYHRSGSFLAGPGFRLDWYQRFDTLSLRFSYDLVRYDFEDKRGALSEHTLRFDADLDIADRTTLGLSLDHRFGNDSDAVSGGVFVQHRF